MSDYFFNQMKNLLGARYAEFKSAYDNKPRHKALRVNTLKISADEFVLLAEKLGGYGLRRNPLCECGFYTDVKPSLDPLYHAGLYYMQEPSAQSAVAAFLPFIGERVLDLCAAPGGKTTQAAAAMKRGVIFCNDVEYKRATALNENIRRLGVKNAAVTVGDAGMYRKAGFDGYFDTLIIDAPCSGGGMMRYESVPYSEDIVKGCAKRQRAILDDAVALLCTGGHMLYSTCTFSREEDEDNVEYLLGKGFSTVDIPLRAGEERGIGIPDARRIYPHNFDGEGHFYCVLEKTRGVSGECAERAPVAEKNGQVRGINALPSDEPKKYRNGRPVDEITYAAVHAFTHDEVKAFGEVDLDRSQAEKYIRGEQIDYDGDERGVRIASYFGHALGLVKIANNGAGDTVMKNLYPKNLRIPE